MKIKWIFWAKKTLGQKMIYVRNLFLDKNYFGQKDKKNALIMHNLSILIDNHN